MSSALSLLISKTAEGVSFYFLCISASAFFNLFDSFRCSTPLIMWLFCRSPWKLWYDMICKQEVWYNFKILKCSKCSKLCPAVPSMRKKPCWWILWMDQFLHLYWVFINCSNLHMDHKRTVKPFFCLTVTTFSLYDQLFRTWKYLNFFNLINCVFTVGPCALEYTKVKTADHFWTDPSADELVQRHRIHSGHCRQDSPSRRPALVRQWTTSLILIK